MQRWFQTTTPDMRLPWAEIEPPTGALDAIYEFNNLKGPSGKVNVRINPDNMDDETKILGAIFHEVYEINAIKQSMEFSGAMKGQTLLDMTRTAPPVSINGGSVHKWAEQAEDLFLAWLHENQ